MKRAIISGATGTVGSALVRNLVSNGVEVLVLARPDSNRNKNIPKNQLITLRYCSLEGLSELKNDTMKDYDVFYHLAWAGTSGKERNDKELQDKNVLYALDAVNCAKRFGCKKFVGIGSQAEYGRKDEVLTPELSCEPENEYGRAKLEASVKTKELAQKLGMHFNWVRILSIYGPNDNKNSLISYVIRELKEKRVPQLTPGEQIWNYLYSKDAADALRLVGDKGIDGKIYVIGSADSRPLKDYIEELRNIVAPGMALNFGAKEYPDKQVMYLKPDIQEIVADTGWRPKASFSDGVKDMAENETLVKNLFQFIKFGLVGISNTAISLGIYYLVIYINKDLYLLGNILGFILSVLNGFYWNNKYVFQSEGNNNWFRKLMKSYISYGGSTLLSSILLYLEVEKLGISETIAPLINLLITVPLNFLVNKKWTFKEEK